MFRPDLIGHLLGDFYNVCSCTHFPKDGLLNQAKTSHRTNQQINNTVQQVGTDSL